MTDRIAALVRLVPDGQGLVVDVGADHGRVADAIAATGRLTLATERLPNRRAASGGSWVIAEGLRPFRDVEVAIIAGMGWRTIARILTDGARPKHAVLHADDDPGALCEWLAANGWAQTAADLVAVGPRFARLVRVTTGSETASGLTVHYGSALLDRRDPLVGRWLRAERERMARIADAAGARPAGIEARAHVRFLDDRLGLWTGPSTG